MAEIALRDITKIYPNGTLAVRNLTAEVKDGEFFVLVGPSGCGKTTTLRMIAGLEEPTRGTIFIGGRAVNALPARERDVAMVFQKSTLYPHLTVRRNLAFGLMMRRRQGTAWRRLLSWLIPNVRSQLQAEEQGETQQIAHTARILGLTDVLERRPAELSGGQQQRVALGRALVRRPGVFLLDEPLSHLDGRLRSELRHELHLLQRRLRATMIYVTHDQAEAMTLADRIVVLNEGVVQQVDEPLAIYERPENRFVAGFFGWPAMNFLEGKLTQADGRLSLSNEDWSVRVAPGKVVGWTPYEGLPVTVGLRPEHVGVSDPGQGGAALVMEVALIEFLGHARLVTLERGGLRVTARLVDRCLLKHKQMVEVFFHMECAHLFDGSTGVNLDKGRLTG